MPRKNLIVPYKLESAKSLATDFQSSVINIENIDNIAFIIETSSVTDNTGTFGVQVRFKKPNSPTEMTEWISLTLDTAPTLADTDGEFYVYLNGLVATEIRLTFTAAGSTPDGTVDIWVSGNQTGG